MPLKICPTSNSRTQPVRDESQRHGPVKPISYVTTTRILHLSPINKCNVNSNHNVQPLYQRPVIHSLLASANTSRSPVQLRLVELVDHAYHSSIRRAASLGPTILSAESPCWRCLPC